MRRTKHHVPLIGLILMSALLVVGAISKALPTATAAETIVNGSGLKQHWLDYPGDGSVPLTETAISHVGNQNVYITNVGTFTNLQLNTLEYACTTTPITRHYIYMPKGKTSGTASWTYTNAGYTTDGTIFDIHMEMSATCATVDNEHHNIIYRLDTAGMSCNARGTQTTVYQGVRLVFTMHFYKAGTTTPLDESPNFAFFLKDMDTPSPATPSTARDFNGPYSEGLELIANYDTDVYLVKPITATNGHMATPSDTNSEDGVALVVTTKNGHPWVHASHICYNRADSSVALIMHDGASFAWTGGLAWSQAWQNQINPNSPDYDSYWNSEIGMPINGMGGALGIRAAIDKYPDTDNPTKAPATQDKNLGEAVSWEVAQTFPYASETNKLQTVAFSDTLDQAFDASETTVKVMKKNGSNWDDVTESEHWTMGTSGQTVTITTSDTWRSTVDPALTGAEADKAKNVVAGDYKFQISSKLKQDVNLGEYSLTAAGKYQIPNTARIILTPVAGDAITKNSNTVHVLVATHPSLSIEKTTPSPSVEGAVGTNVTWNFEVENTGDVAVSNVAVSDELLTGLQPPVSVTLDKTTLAPGEKATGTATMPLSQADIDAGGVTNVAKATGKSVADDSAVESDDDDAEVSIQRNAALSIDKEASKTTAKIGDEISYTIVVTNTGNVTLKNVEITDQKLGIQGEVVSASLAPGASVTKTVGGYTVTEEDAIAGTVHNVATADGEPPTGVAKPAKPEDECNVSVTTNPSLAIEKTVTPATVSNARPGVQVAWKVKVTNTGDVSIRDVSVTDEMLGGRGFAVRLPKAILAAGESTETTVSMPLKQTDIDAGSLKNVAVAHGTSVAFGNSPVDSAPDDATVTVTQSPAISIDKTVDKSSARIGEILTYTMTVTNTGNVTLENVTVTDETLGISKKPVAASLAPGASASTTEKYGPLTEADAAKKIIHNIASATGIPPTGEADAPVDTDETTTPVSSTGGLRIEKSVSPGHVESATTSSSVEWTIRLTNTGDASIDNIVLTDAMLAGRGIQVSFPQTELAPGESTYTTVTMPLTQADINAGKVTNVASATGKSKVDGSAVNSGEAQSQATIGRSASLSIEKSASMTEAKVGDQIEYSFKVTNTGNVTLSNVTVADERLGISSADVADSMAPGETKTIARVYGPVTEQDAASGKIHNVASAHGVPPAGVAPPTRPTDMADVSITGYPRLSLTKEASPRTLEDAKPGDEVEWIFTVSNDGDMSVKGLAIEDELLTVRGIKVVLDKTTLEPNESTKARATMPVTKADIDAGKVTNVATAMCKNPSSPSGTIRSNEAKADVEFSQQASLGLQKSASVTDAKIGETISWEVVVTNTGNVTLENVSITDKLVGWDKRKVADKLEPGESHKESITYSVSSSDVKDGKVTNVAVAEGTPPSGAEPVSSPEADASVNVGYVPTSSKQAPTTPTSTPGRTVSNVSNDIVQMGGSIVGIVLAVMALGGAGVAIARRMRR